MAKQIKKVFLIDDDPLDNFINQQLLEKTSWKAEAVIFKDATSALAALRKMAAEQITWPEVILLDIEMPHLNGWGFLEEYALLPHSYIEPCLLYLLSSSIRTLDIDKAQHYPLIKSYLIKPLTIASLNKIRQDFEAIED